MRPERRIVPFLVLLAAFALDRDTAEAQRNCVEAIPCGTNCLAASTRCRIVDGTAGSGPTRLRASSPVRVPPEAPYVASSRGRVFYATGCDAWRTLAPANLVWFRSAKDAQDAGYTPSKSAGCGSGSPNASRPTAAARVSRADTLCVLASVTDGDTVVCEGGLRVRLLLIDTPEMDQGVFGRRAREHLASLVPLRSNLRMEFDVEQRDRYGRTLAYLYAPNGRMINEEMARAGYAVIGIYPPNVKHVERIRSAVKAAQAARAGLWATSSAFECRPADYRASRCE